MTLTLAADTNNDPYLNPQGRLAVSSGLDAVLQCCASAAKALRGEMIFAVNDGMPNFQTIWGGAPNIPQWEAALRRTLLAVTGVVRIIALSTKIADNTLSYQATILTEFGTGTING